MNRSVGYRTPETACQTELVGTPVLESVYGASLDGSCAPRVFVARRVHVFGTSSEARRLGGMQRGRLRTGPWGPERGVRGRLDWWAGALRPQ